MTLLFVPIPDTILIVVTVTSTIPRFVHSVFTTLTVVNHTFGHYPIRFLLTHCYSCCIVIPVVVVVGGEI